MLVIASASGGDLVMRNKCNIASDGSIPGSWSVC